MKGPNRDLDIMKGKWNTRYSSCSTVPFAVGSIECNVGV